MLSVSCVVIRKSDGRVATLLPADTLDMWCGSTFGRDPNPNGKFAAYPSLRGYLPAQFEQPTALGNPHVHMIRHNPAMPYAEGPCGRLPAQSAGPRLCP